MAVYVSFVQLAFANQFDVQLISGIRATEALTVPDTTEIVAVDGEVALVKNDDDVTRLIAWGTTPDGAAVASTAATTAGLALRSGEAVLLRVPRGAKVNAKALA